MNLFPVVLLGGPPHSGKSVLTYTLTQALRQKRVDHYILRACPDGEGDWTHEAARQLVRRLRVKGEFTPRFAACVARDLARRHLPLIVDTGGQPSAFDGPIFDQCTHAILLYKDPADLASWRGLMDQYAITILAEIRSVAGEEPASRVDEAGLTLRGTFVGLQWGTSAAGPGVEALVERLAALFDYSPDELRAAHFAAAPVETVIDLARLGEGLGLLDARGHFSPHDLPRVLNYLPAHRPLGLYGRGPNWLYAALALHACPAQLAQFDVRLGWVTPLHWPSDQSGTAAWPARTVNAPDHAHLEFQLPEPYLDYDDLSGLAAPPVPSGNGVVLSGKLPLWLWTSLALAYRDAPWLAVFHPPLDRAVVVKSDQSDRPVGALI